MPPKKQNNAGNAKKQQKIIEDKTFGLKNKNKSKKVQQYVQSVSRTPQQIAAEKAAEARRAAKKAQEAMDREMSLMFRTVQKQAKQGMDPKSVLCEYFKQGLCVRGAKCKYSHDATQVRKVAKLDIYTDPRFVDAPDERPNKTDIICKFFLDAVESKKYGSLWICPNNGKDCQYNHAVPKGFVLQRDRKLLAEQQEDGLSIEEQIEIERAALLRRNDLTPVTKETFEKWKIAQKEKAEKAIKDKVKAAMDKKALGKLAMAAGLSGRDLFTFDPSLFVDDMDAADDAEMEIRETGNDDDEDDEKTETLADVVDRNLFLDGDEELPSTSDDRLPLTTT